MIRRKNDAGGGTVFAADLLFVQTHPFFVEADPFQLLTILEEIDRMAFEKIVPGHGPVGTKEDVRLLREYVQFCIKTAERLLEEGQTDDAALAALSLPQPFNTWDIPHFFKMNMQHLLRLLSGKEEK